MHLTQLGWNRYARKYPDHPNTTLGRVGIENKTNYVIHGTDGDLQGMIQGKFRKMAVNPSDYPKVGDWVAYTKLPGEQKAIIDKVLPRYSIIARKAAGDTGKEQVIATNVDTLFILFGLDQAFNPLLTQRYLAMAYEGGVKPIIILNKSDKVKLSAVAKKQAQAIDPQIEVLVISAKTTIGLHEVESHIEPGRTIVFVGPSGSGKSTLINALIGKDLQTTGAVRMTDAKGRHTTTRREMFILPQGGILVDTPGIRELETLGGEDTIRALFSDIEELARKCKFRNCDHITSKGCAVLEAIALGKLGKNRYDDFIRQISASVSDNQTNSRKRQTIERRAERRQKLKKRPKAK